MIITRFNTLYYRCNYILYSVLLLYSIQANSQSENSDNILPEEKDSAYYELFKVNRTKDIKKAKYYAKHSFILSKKYNHHQIHAKACRALGFTFSLTNEIDSARFYYHRGIQISKVNNFSNSLFDLYNDLGLLHRQHDFYDSALYYFMLSYNLAKESQDFKNTAAASHNIGLIYYDLENYKESIDHFNEAIKIKTDNGIALGLNRARINLARTLNVQGLYERADEQLQNIKNDCKTNCDEIILADLNYEFGYSSLMQKKTEEAFNFFSEALMLSRKNNIKQTTAHSLYHLSVITFNTKKIEQSFNYLNEAKTIAKEINHRRLIRDIYHQLSTAYTILGENDKAIQNEILYVHLKDSIFNINVANNVKNIQITEHSRKSNAVIKEQEIALSNSYIFIALLGCVILLTFAVIYLIARALISSRKHRQEMELHVVQMLNYRQYSEKEQFRNHMEFTSLVSRVTGFLNTPVASLFGIAQSVKNATNPTALDKAANKMLRVCSDIHVVLKNMNELLLYKNHDLATEELIVADLIDDVKNDFKKQKSFLILNVTVDFSVSPTINTDKQLIQAAIIHAIKYFDHTEASPIVELILSRYDENTLRIVIKHHSKSNRALPYRTQFNHLTVFVISGKLGGDFQITQFEDHTLFEIFVPSNLPTTKAQTSNENISIE